MENFTETLPSILNDTPSTSTPTTKTLPADWQHMWISIEHISTVTAYVILSTSVAGMLINVINTVLLERSAMVRAYTACLTLETLAIVAALYLLFGCFMPAVVTLFSRYGYNPHTVICELVAYFTVASSTSLQLLQLVLLYDRLAAVRVKLNRTKPCPTYQCGKIITKLCLLFLLVIVAIYEACRLFSRGVHEHCFSMENFGQYNQLFYVTIMALALILVWVIVALNCTRAPGNKTDQGNDLVAKQHELKTDKALLAMSSVMTTLEFIKALLNLLIQYSYVNKYGQVFILYSLLLYTCVLPALTIIFVLLLRSRLRHHDATHYHEDTYSLDQPHDHETGMPLTHSRDICPDCGHVPVLENDVTEGSDNERGEGVIFPVGFLAISF